MKHFMFKHIKIHLGENKYENWELLESSKPCDIFLHLNSFPSGHIKIEMDIFNSEIIRYAGEICKKYSKYKNLKNIKICYCTYNNVYKTQKIGEVTFKSNKKVCTMNLY
jgi:predicted ribosome quality control (RQC) complex YloA/Tae2 family protein